MNIVLDWKNLIYLNSQLIGYLIGLVLILYGYRKNKSNMLLGFIFIVFSFSSFITWLIFTGNFIYFPELYRIGNFFALFIIPVVYLYIQSVIKKKYLGIWELLHFIPALVFLIDHWPVYLLDNDIKLELIKKEIADPILFTQFNQSRLFSINFYSPFRTFQLAIYWIFSVRLVWNYDKKFKLSIDDFGKKWLVWIKIFLGFELLLFLPSFLFFRLEDPIILFQVSHSFLALITLITAISLLFFPQILYGLDREKYEAHKVKGKSDKVENLTNFKIKEIELKLHQALNVEKKFLQRSYSIHSLAENTGIPNYLLTIYLNQHLQTNFSDLINQKRVDEACELITSGKYGYLSLLGLAELCGFNNRNSFTQAFQKFKDVSPSVYIKSQKELAKN